MTPLTGSSPRAARLSNTAAVVVTLQQGGTSQAELADQLGLTQSSVSRIVQPLIDSGLVRVRQATTQGPGRPAARLEIDPRSRAAVGVHLGRAEVRVGLTDLSGQCLQRVVCERDDASPDSTLEQVVRLVENVAQNAQAPVVGVGIASPGEVDPDAGVVRHNTALGWRDVEVTRPVSDALGLPVALDSTVCSMLAAESTFGNLDPTSPALLLLLAEVLECGYTVRDHSPIATPVHGDLSRMLVPGLQPGDVRPFGEVGTNGALVAAARARRLAVAGMSDLLSARERGEPVAVDLLDRRHEQVVAVLEALTGVLHPEVVILGGLTAPAPTDLERIRQHFADQFEAEAIRRPGPFETPLLSPAAALAIRQALVGRATGTWEVSA